MGITKASPDEIAQRGDQIYERSVRAEFEKTHSGKIVAIDITSSAYALGETSLEASKTLKKEHPKAIVWLVRIGERALHRIG